MDFLRTVEDELSTLSHESRKKFPIVKEAAEKAVVKVRSIREEYAHAVRLGSTPSPGHSMFRSRDLLQPFLLACNHTQASSRILMHSLVAVQRLISFRAVEPADVPNIVRVLHIQTASSTSSTDIQLKVLQTLLQLLTTSETLENSVEPSSGDREDILADALWICFYLSRRDDNSVLKASAASTVRQVVTMVFDRVQSCTQDLPPPQGIISQEGCGMTSIGGSSSTTAVTNDHLPSSLHQSSSLRVAYLLFQDLCRMSRGEDPVWLKKCNVKRDLCLELIDGTLCHCPDLFRGRKEFVALIRDQMCPLILSLLNASPMESLSNSYHSSSSTSSSVALSGSSKSSTGLCSFPLFVRAMRLTSTLLNQLSDVLLPETNAILTTLIEIISHGFSSYFDGTTVPAPLSPSSSGHHEKNSFKKTQSSSSSSLSSSSSSHTHHDTSSRIEWPTFLALEVLSKFCSASDMVNSLYKHHDAHHHKGDTRLYIAIVSRICFILSHAPPTDFRRPQAPSSTPHSSTGHRSSTSSSSASLSSASLSSASSKVSVGSYGSHRGLDLLSDEDPPPEPATFFAIRTAVVCLANIVQGIDHEVRLSTSRDTDLLLRRIQETGGFLLISLCSVLSLCEDTELIQFCLKSFHSFTSSCKKTQLDNILSRYILTLSHFSLPMNVNDSIRMKHVQIMQTLFNLMHSFTLRKRDGPTELDGRIQSHGVSDEIFQTWLVVLQLFEIIHEIASSSSTKQTPNTSSKPPNEDVLHMVVMLENSIQDFFLSHTEDMEQNEFCILLKALIAKSCDLSAVSRPVTPPSSISDNNLCLLASESPSSLKDDFAKKLASAAAITNIVKEETANKVFAERTNSFLETLEEMEMELPAIDASVLLTRYQEKFHRANDTSEYMYYMKRLVDVAKSNIARMKVWFDSSMRCFLKIAWKASIRCLREAAVDAMLELIQEALSNSNLVQTEPSWSAFSHSSLFQPLQELILKSSSLDVLEKGCNGISDILQKYGHLIEKDGWNTVLNILSSVAKMYQTSKNSAKTALEKSSHGDGSGLPTSTTTANTVGGGQTHLVHLCFRSVRLILDDFFVQGQIQEEEMISCVGNFVLQKEDVNVSLTGVNELWTIADSVKRKEKSKKSNIFLVLFQELNELGRKELERVEVRNCILNTLCSAVVSHGGELDERVWTFLFEEVFGSFSRMIRDQLAEGSSSPATNGNGGKDGNIMFHHSRNTTEKQWKETHALLVAGITKVLRSHLPMLLEISARKNCCFSVYQVWKDVVLEILRQGIKHEHKSTAISKELSLACITSLSSLVQMVSEGGVKQAIPLRAGIGMRVVGGTLSSSSGPPPSTLVASDLDKKLSSANCTLWRESVALMEEFGVWLIVELERRVEDMDRKAQSGGIEKNLSREEERQFSVLCDVVFALIQAFVSTFENSKEQEFQNFNVSINFFQFFFNICSMSLKEKMSKERVKAASKSAWLELSKVFQEGWRTIVKCHPYPTEKMSLQILQQLLHFIHCGTAVLKEETSPSFHYMDQCLECFSMVYSSLQSSNMDPRQSPTSYLIPFVLSAIFPFFFTRQVNENKLKELEILLMDLNQHSLKLFQSIGSMSNSLLSSSFTNLKVSSVVKQSDTKIWKMAEKVLIQVIQFELISITQSCAEQSGRWSDEDKLSCWEAICILIEGVIYPDGDAQTIFQNGSALGGENMIEKLREEQAKMDVYLLETLLEKVSTSLNLFDVKEVYMGDPSRKLTLVVEEKMLKLLQLGAFSSIINIHPLVSQACLHHLAAIGGIKEGSNSSELANEKAQEMLFVCCGEALQQLSTKHEGVEDDGACRAVSILEKVHSLDLMTVRNKQQFLKISQLLPSLFACITSPDLQVRAIVQKLLNQTRLDDFSQKLVKEDANETYTDSSDV